jgi:hypothetical protein
MISTISPASQYVNLMGLQNFRASSILCIPETNVFIPGGNRIILQTLGRREGEFIYSSEGPPYTFYYHDFGRDLAGLERFRDKLMQVEEEIDQHTYREKARLEVHSLSRHLEAARTAYQALPHSAPDDDRPANLAPKEEEARSVFKALNDFLEVRMGLALISCRTEDPACTYFDLDQSRNIENAVVQTFPK